jgi:putative transposase
MKAYKYKLRISKKIEDSFNRTLAVCCDLYNAGLQERRDAYKLERKAISYSEQCVELTDVREADADVAGIYSQVTQDALRRLNKAFLGFFRRVKAKQTAGYPRFRSKSRYDSFTYPQSGFRLDGDKLHLAKIGSVRLRLSRPVEEKIKTCTIKRQPDGWFVIFTVEDEAHPLPQRSEQIGIDVGLLSFATLSDGTEVDNPRYYREAQKQLRIAQRKVSRRKKGSHRRRKAVQLLARVHQHVRNQRADFHHKISRWLVNEYGTIAVEDLNVKGLAGGMLARSVNDAGWSSFINMLTYKAEDAGRALVKVDPRGTSQTCTCGAHTPKDLSQRWHKCAECGLSQGRDHVSAQVILQRALGQSVLASSPIAG